MKHLLVLLLTLVILLPSVGTAAAQEFPDLEGIVDGILAGQMDGTRVTGAVVTIVSGGQVVLNKGYGVADPAGKLIDPAKSLFPIGSVTKLFAWTAVLQLAERGLIDLDQDINNYLDFEIPSRGLGGQEYDPITMRHLMTHTGGFEDRSGGLFLMNPDQLLPLGQYIKENLPARIYPPGEVVAYSNYGTTLAGYIVQLVSGKSFAQYAQENILQPLGMNWSSFAQILPAPMEQEYVKTFIRQGEEVIFGERLYVQPYPAGGLVTTGADMAKFMLAHLNQAILLQPETFAQMHRQQFAHHQRVEGMTLGFSEYYLNQERILFHGGSTFAYNTGLYLLPQHDIGIFVSYSTSSVFEPIQFIHDFMNHYFPTSTPTPSQSPEAAKRSQQFIGQYVVNRKDLTGDEKSMALLSPLLVRVSGDGFLVVEFMQQSFRYAEVEPGLYQRIDNKMSTNPYGSLQTLFFSPGPDGRILLQTGGMMTFSQVPWYETTPFTIGTLGLSILAIIFSLLFWLGAAVVGVIKNRGFKYTGLSQVARWVALAFALVTLMLLLGFLGGFEQDPVYEVPRSYLGATTASPLASVIPMIMALLGLGLTVFTWFAWQKKYWSLVCRIHYTLFTGAALALLAIIRYWNLA